jgi:alkylation response protein AidB-like acyl-CoA dehydrogenase
MDFEFHFTKEQEDFRKEVRAFIKENAYKEPIVPVDWEFMTPEMYLHGRELQKKLGAKGWFAPAYPKEYGGGGLDVEHCVIIAQEFAEARRAGVWPLNTEVSPIQTGGIMAQGTPEQKKRFLPKLLSGEWEGWQAFTEPEAGSDEAAMSSSAVRDGDSYIINGDKFSLVKILTPFIQLIFTGRLLPIRKHRVTRTSVLSSFRLICPVLNLKL